MKKLVRYLDYWLWRARGFLTNEPGPRPLVDAPPPATEPTESWFARLGSVVATLAGSEDRTRAPDKYVATLGSRTVIWRKVQTYKPPPGVVPAGLASDAANDDGNTLNLWAREQYAGIGFPGYAYLAELAQRSEYRAPCETIAKEMTRKFIKLGTTGKGGDKAEKIAQLKRACKRHNLRQVIRQALEKDMFFGRSQVFIDIKGQESDEARALPLTVAKENIAKGSLRGFKVIEPIWTSPAAYNAQDPTKADFYVPEAWYVLGRKIHASRLLTVISRPVPELLKPAYNFGGISLTQLGEPYVIRWLQVVDSVNRLVRNFSMIFLKTNLSQMLQPTFGDPANKIIERAKFFTLVRDNQAMHLLDKNTEEVEQIAVALGGLDHLQAQAQEHMAAPFHIPLVKLTGVTPSGLNASSEGEIQVWHEWIGSEQQDVAEPILDIMLDIIQLDEFGEIDPDITYEFVPLVEATVKEKAEMRKSDADMGAALIDRMVISPDELREKLQADPDSGFDNLKGAAPEPEPVDPNASPEEGATNATNDEEHALFA